MGQGICHNTCMSVAKLTVNPTPNTGRLLFYIGQVGFMRPHTGRTSVLSDNRGNRKERALMKKASGVYGHIGEEVSSEKFAGWPAILRGPVRNDSAM